MSFHEQMRTDVESKQKVIPCIADVLSLQSSDVCYKQEKKE